MLFRAGFLQCNFFFPALQFFFPALQFPGQLPATVGRGRGGDTLSNEIVVLPLLHNAFLELRSHKMLGIIRRQCGAWYFATGVGEQSLLIILLGTLGILRLQQFLAIPHSIDVHVLCRLITIEKRKAQAGTQGAQHPWGGPWVIDGLLIDGLHLVEGGEILKNPFFGFGSVNYFRNLDFSILPSILNRKFQPFMNF